MSRRPSLARSSLRAHSRAEKPCRRFDRRSPEPELALSPVCVQDTMVATSRELNATRCRNGTPPPGSGGSRPDPSIPSLAGPTLKLTLPAMNFPAAAASCVNGRARMPNRAHAHARVDREWATIQRPQARRPKLAQLGSLASACPSRCTRPTNRPKSFEIDSECEDLFDYVGSSSPWICSSSKRDLRGYINLAS